VEKHGNCVSEGKRWGRFLRSAARDITEGGERVSRRRVVEIFGNTGCEEVRRGATACVVTSTRGGVFGPGGGGGTGGLPRFRKMGCDGGGGGWVGYDIALTFGLKIVGTRTGAGAAGVFGQRGMMSMQIGGRSRSSVRLTMIWKKRREARVCARVENGTVPAMRSREEFNYHRGLSGPAIYRSVYWPQASEWATSNELRRGSQRCSGAETSSGNLATDFASMTHCEHG